MSQIFDFLFGQYSNSLTSHIILELVAIFFGVLSVWYSKKNNILVFPTGMVSTSIFVYLLFKWGLLGDMLINGYYFIMSVYGWFIWTRLSDKNTQTPISKTSLKEQRIAIGIFIATLIFVYLVYNYFDKWINWVAYTDTITTAIFFVGMWLMAKRKIENWIFWIHGNIISVPMYFYKGYTFTSLQYFGFTIIAIFGYLAWKKHLNNKQQIA